MSNNDIENYKQIKSDLDRMRLLVEKSELWVFKVKKHTERVRLEKVRRKSMSKDTSIGVTSLDSFAESIDIQVNYFLFLFFSERLCRYSNLFLRNFQNVLRFDIFCIVFIYQRFIN